MAIRHCMSFDTYGTATISRTYTAINVPWSFDIAGSNIGSIIGDTIIGPPQQTTINVSLPSGTIGIGTPAWGARRGNYAYFANSFQSKENSPSNDHYLEGTEGLRQSIPGSTASTRFIHCAFSIDSLPTDSYHGIIAMFCDANGAPRGYLTVTQNGRLAAYGGQWFIDISANVAAGQTLLGVTSAPVITPQTWYPLSMRLVTTDATGLVDFQVYVGDITPSNLVLDLSGVQFYDTGSDNIDIVTWLPTSIVGSLDPNDITTRWIRDIVHSDSSGSYNTTYLGPVFVSAQETRAEDDEGSNWSVYPRENLGDGILDHTTAQTGLRVLDNAALEIGASDFTVEGFWRFSSLPSSGGEMVLASKWSETTNARSWKLVYDSTLPSLQFIISTNGTSTTTVIDYPYTFETDKWYHIAISREFVSGVGSTRAFVNGALLGLAQTDSATYYNGPASLGVASQWNGTTTLDTTSVFDGYVDEVRLTIGSARYTAPFSTPTAQFGRSVADDADFASVGLLLGFDAASVVDESSNALPVTVGSGVVTTQPGDGDFSYAVLNQVPPREDTYIEAANTFATATLTISANPTATETVTIGAQTYEFVSSFSSNPVNEVLIGASANDSLDNLLAAINNGAGEGTLYGTGTTVNASAVASYVVDNSSQLLLTALTVGTTGNSVASTETLANGSFDNGSTFSGGTDIPSASDFAIERLPIDVTGVLAVQVNARGYKTDAGSATVRLDLVGPSAAVATGTAAGVDLSPSWIREVFEEDPDTSAQVTFTTVTGGRVRVTRTS